VAQQREQEIGARRDQVRPPLRDLGQHLGAVAGEARVLGAERAGDLVEERGVRQALFAGGPVTSWDGRRPGRMERGGSWPHG
jgi:hypothetical protein